MTPQEFIRNIASYSVSVAQRYDVPASLLIAQAILESASGNSVLAQQYNNLTGMKATGKIIPGIWDGRKVNLPTTETINGLTVNVPQEFRIYDTWAQSIEDLADRYATRFKLTLTKVGGNVAQFLAEPGLSEAMKTGYATDTKYLDKFYNIISLYNLQQFDNVTANVPIKKKIGWYEIKKAC